MAPDPEDGQPRWVLSLQKAELGIMEDPDRIAQLIEDHTEYEDLPRVIDLDKLGLPQ